MLETAVFTNSILGVVQGLTEFLPISSSGHLILAREVLGVVGETDLTFDALLHFATASAIVIYFWRDVRMLMETTLRLPSKLVSKDPLDIHDQTVVALAVGTIPAVILGLLLEDIMATVFRNPALVAGTLIAGSLVMLLAEYAVKKDRQIISLGHGWKRGLMIGMFQSLALIPGMSRSGMTISGGMLFGMDRAQAAKFGFLLGVPVLLGAGTRQALELGVDGLSLAVLAGAASAFTVAILVIHFLLKFLQNNTLHVFIAYRLLLALSIFIIV
ncbi:undecaprenyl-diphosphatase UppP [bacterium]|nr:undecaprenyl-diphosphatase UppP [bacterium]|tara:strand:+ start:2977 stop:3792 length:816 start_codon:yes stop_codon:yes gene_type:complete